MGDTLMVFLLRDPLLLVAVARTGESVGHLGRTLEFLYDTVLFFATDKPLKQLRADPLFRIDSHVAGTEQSLHNAVRLAGRTPAVMADGIPMLTLPSAHRARVASALRGIKGARGVVAAAVVVGSEIAAFASHSRHPLRPRDLLLLAAFVQSSPSLRASEAFVPLCLPGVAPSALLHAHVTFLASCPRGAGRSGAAFAEPVADPVVLPVVPDGSEEAAPPADAAPGAGAASRHAGAAARGAPSPRHAPASPANAAGTPGSPGRAGTSRARAMLMRPPGPPALPLAARVGAKAAAVREGMAADPAASGLPRAVEEAAAPSAAALSYARAVAPSFAAAAPDHAAAGPAGSSASSDGPGRAPSSAAGSAPSSRGPAGPDPSEVQLPSSAAPALIDAAAAHIRHEAVAASEEEALGRLEAFAEDGETDLAPLGDGDGEGGAAAPEGPGGEAEAEAAGGEAEAAGGSRAAAAAAAPARPPPPAPASFVRRARHSVGSPSDDVFVVMVGTEITPEAFMALRAASTRVHDDLRRAGSLAAIADAVASGGPVATDVGTAGVVHYVYLWKPLRQLVVAQYPVHMRSHRARKRLLRRYQHLWQAVTAPAPAVRHVVETSPDGTVGAINTTNAVLVCLAAGGGSAGGKACDTSALVRVMEELAKGLRRAHPGLLLDRVPVL